MQAHDIPLGDVLRQRIEAMPGVEIVDRSRYYEVRKGETTLGWVSGSRKLRVDLYASSAPGKWKIAETLYVADAKDIAPALKALKAKRS